VQDARRNQAKDRLASLDDERVPGVVSALEAGDEGKIRREQIDDFSFAFIAPLRAENREVYGRTTILLRNRRSQSRTGPKNF